MNSVKIRSEKSPYTLRPLLALLLLATTPFVAAQSGKMPTGPVAGDQQLSPFYQWHNTLPDKPGVMLREEPMPDQAEIVDAATQLRILYTTRDARWNSGIVPVSGTLYLPAGKMPEGGWPVVAWAHGTLGIADSCAPSWKQHTPRDASYINQWLKQGFAVVATDYQGLGGPGPHPYLNWEAEGRSILDSVRAALHEHPDKLANQLVITGQSQGSGASLGASKIAPTYAADLNLKATIATGVVSTFPDSPVKPEATSFGSHLPARFNMLRVVGGGIPDGGPTAEALTTGQGKPLLELARTTCIDSMRSEERTLKINADNAFVGGNNQLLSVLTPSTDMPLTRFPAPLFLGTGLADRTLSPRHQYAAVAAICAADNPVEWKTYPGVTHNGIVNAAFNDELTFVRAIFAGSTPVNDCQKIADPGAVGTPAAGIPFNN